MAVSIPQALDRVRMVNSSQDFVWADLRDDAGRLVHIEAQPGEVVDVPGEFCVRPPVPGGKTRASAIEMMIPQLKPAPAAKRAVPSVMVASSSDEDANAATAAAFERALKSQQ